MTRFFAYPILPLGNVVCCLPLTEGRKSARCADQTPFPTLAQGNAEMADGTIKKVLDKGFGFIKTSNDKDIFFHSSAVQGVSFNELREGQKVTYTEGMG